jgi:hypothetical protein
MKLANCKEHPDANRNDLTCWALRHDDGRKVTAQEAFDAIEKLESRIAELTLDAERYKIVRRMNPRKFGEVWNENVTTGLHFDWLIDAMKPAQLLPDNAVVSGAAGIQSTES